ncbi:mitochondrial carrier [Teratosphaeria nubilosa]|uniref:Mitochondrial carrier n=1 Tax=Teratosphaeria nubilosa TaxID=161662 RepID=A0A6G1LN98_9PEZI|nr:mitochondrial carrier [Teratosphaeria nubilosa]
MFIPTHPDVIEKDKSIHPEHGVIHYPWYYGGLASCVSTICTQPFGVAGLGAAFVRVSCYSGIRFGMYEKLKEMSTTPTHSPSAYTLAVLAAASGATGSVFSNFADVVCLRIQNDPGLPTAQRRNYKGFAHGLVKMVSEEGLSSIWTGVGIGAGRAAVSTATQLAGYDIAKREFMRRTAMEDDPYTHVSASCLAGFLSTLICNPLDVLKARIMTRSNDTSISVMLKHTFKTEGAIWMFRGMLPALLSRGPSTIITFVTFEQLKHAYRHAHGLED